MLKWIVINIVFIISTAAVGQNEIVPLNNELIYPFESSFYIKTEGNFHSGVKPFLKKEITNLSDSIAIDRIGFVKEKKNNFFSISPIVNASSKFQNGESMRLSYNAGINISANIGEKLGFTGIYAYSNEPRFSFQDTNIFMQNAVNGLGYNIGNNTTHYNEFYLNYNPNKFFTFTAGNGKHFWGDGYRSMMLSDNAAPYPFLRIMSTFWNVKYTNLYSMHTDTYHGKIQRKFATSHQLSWNIIKNLNLTIFESVIFLGKDSLTNRGFDVNYLNPVVFYRPIEYAQGSSDNVLLGASLKYVLLDKYVFYGQMVLDEFLLSEYRDNNGWWANKYAGQIGFKTYDIAGIKNLSLQSEINFIRPFTFSHLTSLLNYGHQGQALAHPLGANFRESVTRVRYQLDKWYFEAKVIYIDRGEDFDAVSYGGDIYRSYALRDSEYDHEIGQGERHFIWYNELKLGYTVLPKINMRAFASYAFRSDKTGNTTQKLSLIQFGITSALWNTYSDY